MAVDAIIFDFDGVIIDTETPDFESWRDLFRERGLDLAADLWINRVGATADNLHFDPASHFQKLTGTALEDAHLKQQRAAYIERCGQQPILPGSSN